MPSRIWNLFDMRDLIIHDWPLIGWKYFGLAVLYALAYIGGFSRRRLPGFPPESGKLENGFVANIFFAVASRCWCCVSASLPVWCRNSNPCA